MVTIPEALAVGLQHHRAGQLHIAENVYKQILAADPRNSEALYYLGVLASQSGNKLSAVEFIGQAIGIDPGKGVYHYNLGEALQVLGRLDQAAEAYRRALQLNPRDAEAFHNLGRVLQTLGRTDEAIEYYQRSLELNPTDVEALNNLGGALQSLGNLDAAVACYLRALQLRPEYLEVHCNLGNVLKAKAQPEAALECYRRALQLNPHSVEALNGIVCQLQELCSWQEYEHLSLRVIQAVENANAQGINHQLSPLSFVGLPTPTTPEQQQRFARNFVGRRFGTLATSTTQKGFEFSRTARNRIRIGFLSGDLQTHPVGMSICELFENHDHELFELFGYSFGIDDHSVTRKRIVAACDHFVDIRSDSFADSAQRIHADQIDILVDLMGHTHGARTEIVALRPAPIQVQFLGFAGTMGAHFIDYLIADEFVVPLEKSCYYTERLVRLPNCFFPSDTKRPIFDTPLARADHGLPGSAVVFCSFNNSSKLTPSLFDVWMRLLLKVPNSVLWIYVQNEFALANLRKEAATRGVAGERIVVAKRLESLNAHLARYRLADLFLDTFPYNAHSTASDALWGGCPVLTLTGQTFASRVAGSLLHAVGMPELVTYSLAEYERKALELANNPAQLAELRTRLRVNRSTCPLFDSQQYARNFDQAYMSMWERYLTNQPPESIRVTGR